MSDVEMVREWVELGQMVDEVLRVDGPLMVERLVEGRSLRELSRMVGLSPTYLSQVRSGVSVISPGSYLRLAEVFDESSKEEEEEPDTCDL
jgi:plasmid maintenance system antidote protein VapI